ncbi:MAG: hypothetical protein HC810_07605 [Acaryochloridaceae cyanobacterium RL_2_7]|nr:hypothetical protein [Acaryochloridaceae cyanobacterium RL_2_7]
MSSNTNNGTQRSLDLRNDLMRDYGMGQLQDLNTHDRYHSGASQDIRIPSVIDLLQPETADSYSLQGKILQKERRSPIARKKMILHTYMRYTLIIA